MRAEIARLQRENRALSLALQEMERIAQRDMLTPLYNRRHFLSALHQSIARVERSGERVALIYVDVDGLKAINDRYGHATGDYVLIEIATRLADMVNEGDILARIGGDEFGILLNHVSLSGARARMDQMRAAITDQPCRFGDDLIALSAAFGMTMVVPGMSAEELIGHADADMYRAKRALA